MKKTFYVLAVMIPLFVGCGQRVHPDGLPKLHPVTLDLSQGGEPLTEATVSLYPANETNRWSSGGFSDANGHAILVTHGGFNGVPIGKYKVAVIKSTVEEIPGTPDKEETSTAFTLVEKMYTSRQTTPLEIDVREGQNVIRLEVGGSVKNKTI